MNPFWNRGGGEPSRSQPPTPPIRARPPRSQFQSGQSADAIRQSNLNQQLQMPFPMMHGRLHPSLYNSTWNYTSAVNSDLTAGFGSVSMSQDRSTGTLDNPRGGTQTFALGEPKGQCGTKSSSGDEASGGELVGIPGPLPMEVQLPPPCPNQREGGGDVHGLENQGESNASQTQSLTDEVAMFQAGNEVIKAKGKDNGNELAEGGNRKLRSATVRTEKL